jgi:hypothetical protein
MRGTHLSLLRRGFGAVSGTSGTGGCTSGGGALGAALRERMFCQMPILVAVKYPIEAFAQHNESSRGKQNA